MRVAMTTGARRARISYAVALLIAGPVGLLIAAPPAWAEDTVTKDAMANRMLKDCMSKKVAATSEDDQLAACKRQVDREMKNARKEELSKGPTSTEPGPPK